MKPITSYTRKLDHSQQAGELKSLLKQKDYEFYNVPYASFAARGKDVNVVAYESGKLVVQGKGTEDFVKFTFEPLVLKKAELGYEEILDENYLKPRLGIDESGKGDFFGPMCVAGVYVNADAVRAMKEAGVTDSKNISSDRRIADLAKLILDTPGCIVRVVPIGNEAYNRLYRSMKSVNAILAWGHARVLENLLLQKHRMNPLPELAICDQFAAKTDTIANALMGLGREVRLVQRHKAESDLAVAAASIMARNEFVQRLKKMGDQYEVTFPKGASKAVDRAAKEFFETHGAEELGKVGKMHFRTSYRARGLPEPPKVDYRKKFGNRQD